MITLVIIIIIVIMIFLQFIHALSFSRDRLMCFTGTLGSGKTLLSVYIALKRYKASLFGWRVKCLFTKKNKRPEKPKLYSNFPIVVNRKKKELSHILKLEHLLMIEKMPWGSVTCITEFSDLASQYDFDNTFVRFEITEFARWYRQYIGGYLILDTQATDEIVKPVRVRLGTVYSLSNIRRFLFITPFLKVNAVLMNSTDGIITILDAKDKTETEYFIIPYPYKWQKKKRKYDSYCYSVMYQKKFENLPQIVNPLADCFTWGNLKCDYLVKLDDGQPKAKQEKLIEWHEAALKQVKENYNKNKLKS